MFLGSIGEVAIRTGDWPMALEALGVALDEEFERADRATLLAAAIPLLALRGTLIDDRLSELRRLVHEGDAQQLDGSLQIVAAFSAFASGDLEKARTAWRATAVVSNYVTLPLPRAARAALWSDDLASARDDLVALDASAIHGPAVEADRRTILAGIAALEGRPGDALPLYREALLAWRDLGLAWDEALCGLDMTLLLDPADSEVRNAGEAAREILVRLEAAPFIARVDAALAGPADPAGRSLAVAERARATTHSTTL